MTDRLFPKNTAFSEITEARLTLGQRGRAQDTKTSLGFALDHARARLAVGSDLDLDALSDTFQRLGQEIHAVRSAAADRHHYIRRPDLGRRLAGDATAALAKLPSCDVALVLGDGLSAVAAMLNGPTFLAELQGRLEKQGMTCSPVIVASQARVAIGDAIGETLGATIVVVALGERPGLSASDSLGAYITYDPVVGLPDSRRNCISNIRQNGLAPIEAADQACRLIAAMREARKSGVSLSQTLAAGALPGD